MVTGRSNQKPTVDQTRSDKGRHRQIAHAGKADEDVVERGRVIGLPAIMSDQVGEWQQPSKPEIEQRLLP